jgi:hypothetical protein
LKLSSPAIGLPTTPYRFGPTMLAPPFSKLWQAAQTCMAWRPASGSALASSGLIGSGPFGSSALSCCWPPPESSCMATL